MSRTKRDYERERRLRKFIPKSKRREKRFWNELELMETGTVVWRPHGQRRHAVSECV